MILKDGTDAHYGLGIDVVSHNGRRILTHGGEVGGFVAQEVIYPDDHAAIAVLTNEVASSAASKIAVSIEPLLFGPPATNAAAPADTFAPQLKTIVAGLQHSQIDRSLFTADCNAYFDKDALADFQLTLVPLGTITSVERTRTALRGGMTFGLYKVAFSGGTTVLITVYLEPDGKIEQLLVVGKA
jgi:D-alanyl-D-alanine carboxypeptidase